MQQIVVDRFSRGSRELSKYAGSALMSRSSIEERRKANYTGVDQKFLSPTFSFNQPFEETKQNPRKIAMTRTKYSPQRKVMKTPGPIINMQLPAMNIRSKR